MNPVERIRAGGVSLLTRAGEAGAIPLVLLHGIGSNAQTWAATMTALDPAIPVIAWNAPGYGESEPVDASTPTPSHYAERLAALLDALEMPRVMVAGHSLGCLFAGRFAATYPDRVAGLAVFSPALGNRMAAGGTLPPGQQARIDDLRTLGPAGFAQARGARLVFNADAKPDILKGVQTAMAAVDPAGYAQAVHALASGDLLADCATLAAARIRVASVVGTGAEDLVTPPANAEAAHAALRCATTLLCVANAGHALPQEDPVAVANLLNELAIQVRHG